MACESARRPKGLCLPRNEEKEIRFRLERRIARKSEPGGAHAAAEVLVSALACRLNRNISSGRVGPF